jgi:hypothetical protein
MGIGVFSVFLKPDVIATAVYRDLAPGALAGIRGGMRTPPRATGSAPLRCAG